MTASKDLFQHHESFKVNAFHRRSFPPEVFHTFLDGLEKKSAGLLHIRSVGQSFEGRPIRLATIGNGKTTILLWSQMHG
ncbi:MAG: peptidase M14, partial [Ignavibacteriales bacterium]|nr:peptidase M14 [Ignavibacteriales bacterium]